MTRYFTIKTKIFGVIMLTAAIFGSGWGVTVSRLALLGKEVRYLSSVSLPVSKEVARVEDSLALQWKLVEQLPTAREEAHRNRLREQLALQSQEMRSRLESARAAVQSAVGWSGKIAPNLVELQRELVTVRQELEQLHERIALAAPDGLEKLKSEYQRFSSKLSALEQANLTHTNQLVRRVELETRQNTWIFVFLAVTLPAGMILAMWVSRGVVSRLAEAERIAAAVIAGDLEVEIPTTHDELGRFFEALRRMVEAMRKRLQFEWMVRRSEKLTLLGNLAIGMAHEVTNPLANAAMNLQLLRGMLEPLPCFPEAAPRLRVIEKNLDKAVAIARELLYFSRPSRIDLAPVNLHDPLLSALLLMEHKLRGIKIHQELLEVPDIEGSYGKLEQVFLNLLKNAADAMPEGGELFINVFRNGNEVIATVRDTGTGIPIELQSKVFEPFFSTKPDSAGFGLGLPLCANIIDQHNGRLELASTPGQGTAITIRLPISKKNQDNQGQSS